MASPAPKAPTAALKQEEPDRASHPHLRDTGNPQVAAMQSAKPDPAGIEFFERKIRPVLADKCYECHSADAKKIKGGLVLDTREGIRRGGDNGPAVVAGDLKASLLSEAI